jgi:predicted transcriptional regulator
MATLLEMAASIVAAHASTSPMTKQELLAEIQSVYNALSAMEQGIAPVAEQPAEEETAAPAISKRKAFGKDKITCMICGKSMKTLARHLKTAHDMKPGEYRKQFGISRTQPLAAKAYSESRKQMAIDMDLGAGLAKAREARKEKAGEKGTKKTSAKKPASKKTKSAPA